MNHLRSLHSSCQLGAHIYVFCGVGINDVNIKSVEKLSIEDDPNLQVSKGWELIPEKNLTTLPGLYHHLSVPLNDFEIVILGGHDFAKGNV